MNKQRIDQSAHVGIALIAALLAANGIFGGLLIGLSLGLVREVTEEGDLSLANLKAALGSRLDLSMWTLGGVIGGAL